MHLFFDQIGNRELAWIFYLFALGILALFFGEVRKSAVEVLRAAISPYLLAPLVFYALLIFATVRGLYALEIWNFDQLFATFFWFITAGVVLTFRAIEAPASGDYFRKLISDTLSVTILFEFVAVAYSFSLVVEIVLVPVIFILSFAAVHRVHDQSVASVRKLSETFIIIAGIAIALNSIQQVYLNWGSFASESTARNFFLPIFLTAASVPAAYALFCVSIVQKASHRLHLKIFQTDDVRKYAKRRFLILFGWRPRLYEIAARQFFAMPAMTREDVEKIIQEIFLHKERSSSKFAASIARGWHPSKAETFLASAGFQTGDYHNTFYDGEWRTQSGPKSIDNNLFESTVNYSILGDNSAVLRLQLTGHFVEHEDISEALRKFVFLSTSLVNAAGVGPDEKFERLISMLEPFNLRIGEMEIALERSAYPSQKGFELILTVEHGSRLKLGKEHTDT